MKRLHSLYEWIDNIQSQIFSMEEGNNNENVNGEMNYLNVPKDFYAMSQMCEFMENSAIEALEKLDKKVSENGDYIDYTRLTNFFNKFTARLVQLENEIKPYGEDVVEMVKRFDDDVGLLADEVNK
jgi:hypothetical protein